jgi:carboxypeptidase T
MKSRVPSLVFLLAIACFATSTPAARDGDEPLFRARIESADPAALRSALERAGYDVLRVDASTVDVAASRAELSALEKSGLSPAIIEQGRPFGAARGTATALTVGSFDEAGLPVQPNTYLDVNGLLTRMQEIEAAYPAIAKVVDITATYNSPATAQGRHLFALKISDNVMVDEDEPAMLIVANFHAREIGTPVIALTAADRLTTGYDGNPESPITQAVDSHEIWIAPTWNPDGYNHVFTTDNMWRKNRRVFSNGVGVDPNRNFPQGWSASCAGSTSVSSETYKGPSAASEAETQTMMAWSQVERFAKLIDYHSFGREVLYSYRCLSHPFTSWMRQEAITLSQISGYGGAVRLPSAEGEHYEWQFAKMGVYAFLIETHSEFQPTYDSAVAEAAQLWPGILSVLQRPISISGHVTDAATGAPLAARIDILNVAFSNGETNGSGGAFGAYHMFLPAGTYDVRFSATGYSPVVHRVTVPTTPPMVLDVALAAAAPEVDVFSDNFETNLGWTRNPAGTDNATAGLWERGDPQSTSSAGPKQLGTTVSGLNDLVTGRLAGSSSGVHDLDGGISSIGSPAITLPATGTLTLSFSYYFAHGSNSSSTDYLRVKIIGDTTATVFEEIGAANDDDAVWAAATVNLSPFAGQTIRILIEAADTGGASLVEAAIDDVRIVRQ